MTNTKIEWAHDTANTHKGCLKVSPGCANCYAEQFDRRNLHGKQSHWGPLAKPHMQLHVAESVIRSAQKKYLENNVRRRVFVNSHADTFQRHQVPEYQVLLDQARALLWRLVDECPGVDFLFLTKRPENVADMVPPRWLDDWPPHAWLGVSVEDQQRADERIPVLIQLPAKIRFLSCEPLLGPVDITREIPAYTGVNQTPFRCDWRDYIDWVIVGGESGHGARPMHPEWARQLRHQCYSRKHVAFFFKQYGDWAPGSPTGSQESLVVPMGVYGKEQLVRVGKRAAGNLLDGHEWKEFPKTYDKR